MAPPEEEERKQRRKEIQARYRANNYEKVRAGERASKDRYKARHPEKYAESARQNARNWRRKYPERMRDTNRRWYEANARAVRGQWIQAKYGITLAEWEEKFLTQGQVCGCCGGSEPGRKGWQTDHDHQTGALRDILCGACNKGLGLFSDSPARLQQAIAYLARHGRRG